MPYRLPVAADALGEVASREEVNSATAANSGTVVENPHLEDKIALTPVQEVVEYLVTQHISDFIGFEGARELPAILKRENLESLLSIDETKYEAVHKAIIEEKEKGEVARAEHAKQRNAIYEPECSKCERPQIGCRRRLRYVEGPVCECAYWRIKMIVRRYRRTARRILYTIIGLFFTYQVNVNMNYEHNLFVMLLDLAVLVAGVKVIFCGLARKVNEVFEFCSDFAEFYRRRNWR